MSIYAYMGSSIDNAVPVTALAMKSGLGEAGSMEAQEFIDTVEEFLEAFIVSAEFMSARAEVAAMEEAASRGESILTSRSHPWALSRSAREALALGRLALSEDETIHWS